MTQDAALVFHDVARTTQPATHVFIVAAGRYDFGKGKSPTPIGGDLSQLTSPPVTARIIADWFLTEYKNSSRPIGSLSMCLSDEGAADYNPPGAAQAVSVPQADLPSVEAAAFQWSERLKSHHDNLAVFYFCGHGVSLGQKAALLLSDFGQPVNGYNGAIDLEKLRGTMKNSPANQQLFLLDCCRTKVDNLYDQEPDIGSRILSIPPAVRVDGAAARQCILFPTIDGEEAFGQRDKPSVFATSFLDAVRFAAPDDSTGSWISTTSLILNAVDRLIRWRLPEDLTRRAVPSALDTTNFDFNEIDNPTDIKGFVKLSDPLAWPNAELTCTETDGGNATFKKNADDSDELACCVFDLTPGEWTFSAALSPEPPQAQANTRTLTRPVAYVELEVQP